MAELRTEQDANMSSPPSLAHTLSHWAMDLRFDQAPSEVQRALRCCLLYNLSMALAVDQAADALGQTLSSIAGADGPARLFAARGRRSAADAAFINAGLITARGQNDTHPEVVTHIGCIVIPAVLALAEMVEAPGQRVLDALLVGYESIPRIAQNLAARSTQRGFRASSLYGSLGAALACSVVLGLSAQQARNALSIATNLASGLLQTWTDGSQEWRLQIAKTSRDSVHAALLAREGLSGAPFCLEGSSGFGAAYAATTPTLDFTGWKTPQMVFKPYPGCAFNQAPVQALRDLLATQALDAADVDHIDVYLHPSDAQYPGVALHGPFASPSGAIMRAPFLLAAALVCGLPRTAHVEQQHLLPALHQLAQRIRVQPSASIAPWTCDLALTTIAGRVHKHSFAPEHLFQLDWEQTLVLAAQVAQEWPGPQAEDRFERLVASLARIETQGLDLALLGQVVYTQ